MRKAVVFFPTRPEGGNLSYIYIPQATKDIDPDAFGDLETLIIFGYAGSEAEDFASAHTGYTFIAVS